MQHIHAVIKGAILSSKAQDPAAMAAEIVQALVLEGHLRYWKRQASGVTTHPAYTCWSCMMNRCYRPKDGSYPDYGGRGIVVCDEWHDAKVFYAWADANGFEPGLTVERIDNDLNYCPENCRMLAREDQPKNRRTNRYIEYGGERLTIAEAARRVGISGQSFGARLNNGWSVEAAMTTPANPYGAKRKRGEPTCALPTELKRYPAAPARD